MAQLTYDEICQFIGRQMLENESQKKELFRQFDSFKEEFVALKQQVQNGPTDSPKTS